MAHAVESTMPEGARATPLMRSFRGGTLAGADPAWVSQRRHDDLTHVEPALVVEVSADSALQNDRWRHAVRATGCGLIAHPTRRPATRGRR